MAPEVAEKVTAVLVVPVTVAVKIAFVPAGTVTVCGEMLTTTLLPGGGGGAVTVIVLLPVALPIAVVTVTT